MLHPLLLWVGWVIGPVAWALHLLISYVLVTWVCESGHHWTLHVTTLVTLVMSLIGAWLTWRQWSVAGRQWPGGNDSRSSSRIQFMAVGGLMLSVLSALLIVTEGIPNFFLGACL